MKKGFTLIELLAVIVILAVIALIASPIIIGLIDDARKEAFKTSAYGIVKAGEIFYAKNMMNGTIEEIAFSYEDGEETSSVVGKKLDYNGTKPKSGSVVINSEGQVAIAIHNGTYCTEKGYEESEVTLSDKTEEECILIFLPNDKLCGADFVDIRDNNTYKTILIGNQCWMAEDLRYDCSLVGYNNIGTGNSWSGESNCGNQGTGYNGLLYQWPVAMKGSTTEGAQGLCPSGWHIPTDGEWTSLEEYLGDSSVAATKLKAIAPDWNGTDNYGFNAKPAGYRYTDGSIDGIDSVGVWWSSYFTDIYFWVRGLYSANENISHFGSSQASGYSVRCLLD